MKLLSPLVWHEGMHLSQHHFQAQSRYFEDLAAFTLSHLSPGPWGLLEIGLDHGALSNGTAAILHARGVLPDGTSFHFPLDPSPGPLAFADDFSPTESAHLLVLALPAHDPERPNCAVDATGPSPLRYSADTGKFVDQNSGREERAVPVARKNFRLFLEGSVPEGMVTLPVARIRRDGSGNFVFDADFVAPSLTVGSSRRLLDLLDRLVAMLEAKAETLVAERMQRGGADSEGSAGELASYWLSHAMHSALPSLRHILQARTVHPERLFSELSRLGGALCTFSLDASPGDLPSYDHGAPDRGFAVLDAHIRRHLDLVLPAGAIHVPLRAAVPAGEGKDEELLASNEPGARTAFFAAPIRDPRMLGTATWYLGVRSSAPPPEVARQVPELLKICSSRFVVRLVREALPGLGMEFVQSPPTELGPRPDTQYFRLLRTEPCWTAIARGGEVGMYVPDSIPDAQLTLQVILSP
ncbi:type VI secretion system baseplate subunit TssK [soil metagenome]